MRIRDTASKIVTNGRTRKIKHFQINGPHCHWHDRSTILVRALYAIVSGISLPITLLFMFWIVSTSRHRPDDGIPKSKRCIIFWRGMNLCFSKPQALIFLARPGPDWGYQSSYAWLGPELTRELVNVPEHSRYGFVPAAEGRDIPIKRADRHALTHHIMYQQAPWGNADSVSYLST